MSSERERDTKRPGGMRLVRIVRSALESPDFERDLEELGVPPERLINPLISALCATDEPIRWRAVRAVGVTVSRMAEKSVESARIILRRLIWSLNDESGGIGWGAPEAMGEIMAGHATLAREYCSILLSYIDEAGNPLEHDGLERGVLWGVGRLAQRRPELVLPAKGSLMRQLRSHDPVKRGLAVWALGFLRPGREEAAALKPLLQDDGALAIYQDGNFLDCRVQELAANLLAAMEPAEGTGS